MAKITQGTGVALILLGTVTLALVEHKSVTALIPTFIGILLFNAGLLATKEKLRMHAVHAALLVAIIGLLGAGMNVAKLPQLFSGEAERPAAIIESTIMAVVLLAYIAVGVRSFINARRWKKEA